MWSGSIDGFASTVKILTELDNTNINVKAEVVFTQVVVDGKVGSMTIEMRSLNWPAHSVDNHGTWVIQNATGGLEGLHGEGEWINSESASSCIGNVHFSP